jgi:hypothetical protein
MVNINNFSSNIFPSIPSFWRKCGQMMSPAQVNAGVRVAVGIITAEPL